MPGFKRKGGKGGGGPMRRFNAMAALPGDMSHGDRSFDHDGEPMHSDPRVVPAHLTSGSSFSR